MKKIKKLLALVMAMTMVLGMAITVSAAPGDTANATVVVSDVNTFYYDQIVVVDPSSTDGWAYDTDYTDLADDVAISDLIAIAKEGTANGDARDGKLTTSSDLAGLLEGLKSRIQVPAHKVDGNTFPAQSAGLYVVIPEKTGYTYSPTLVYVQVNASGNIPVAAKGAEDQIRKDIETDVGESVSKGDIIKYTVKVEYPYIPANYTDATFKITDTLTNGTFVINNADYKVTVTGIGTATYTVSDANNTNNMEIKFSNYDSTKAGSEITITYWVKVGDVNAANPLENNVVSELKLTTDGEPIKTEYKVVSTPVKAVINKVNKDSKKLPGAVFALWEGQGDDAKPDTLVSIIADATNTDGITLPSDYREYASLLIADGNAEGIVTFDGLDAQKDYYVVEIIAPNGYKIDGENHQLIQGGAAEGSGSETTSTTVDGVMLITKTYKFNDFKVNQSNNNIVNDTLPNLPETGGIGTTIFTIGGCVIMIAAAALFFVNRRKSEEN